MLMKAGLLTADHRGPKVAKGPTDPLFPVIGLQILRASDPGLPTPNYHGQRAEHYLVQSELRAYELVNKL